MKRLKKIFTENKKLVAKAGAFILLLLFGLQSTYAYWQGSVAQPINVDSDPSAIIGVAKGFESQIVVTEISNDSEGRRLVPASKYETSCLGEGGSASDAFNFIYRVEWNPLAGNTAMVANVNVRNDMIENTPAKSFIKNGVHAYGEYLHIEITYPGGKEITIDPSSYVDVHIKITMSDPPVDGFDTNNPTHAAQIAAYEAYYAHVRISQIQYCLVFGLEV